MSLKPGEVDNQSTCGLQSSKIYRSYIHRESTTDKHNPAPSQPQPDTNPNQRKITVTDPTSPSSCASLARRFRRFFWSTFLSPFCLRYSSDRFALLPMSDRFEGILHTATAASRLNTVTQLVSLVVPCVDPLSLSGSNTICTRITQRTRPTHTRIGVSIGS